MRFSFAIALLAVSACGATAFGQQISPEGCPSRPDDAKARRKMAGEWFFKAEGFADAHRYAEAVAAFACSIRMVEHPDTVFNAARAAKLAGDKGAAVRYAERYLVLAPEGEVAEEARRLLEELQEAPDKDGAATDPVNPGDGPAGQENASSQPPDDYKAAAATDPESASATPAEPTSPDASKKPPDVISAASRSADHKTPILAVAGYTSLGVGVVGVAVGAVLQGLASKAWADGNATTSYRDFQDYQHTMERCQTGALVGLITGGIVSGAGIAMLLVRHGAEKERVAAVFGPSGLGISGRF